MADAHMLPGLSLRIVALAALASILVPPATIADEQAEPFAPSQSAPVMVGVEPEGEVPLVKAFYFDQRPKIDGLLDDECWASASPLTGFWAITFDRPATEETEVRVGYDEKNIYVGVFCFDSQPELIKAVEKKRGASIARDDFFAVYLDTLHQHPAQPVRAFSLGAYGFKVTPAGTQYDVIPGGSADKIEWRGDWGVSTRTGKKGWTAEIAVPFAILRVQPDQDVFGIWFERHLAREDEFSHWPKMLGTWNKLKTANWVGLRPPRIRRPICLMLFGLLNYREGQTTWEAGLDVKTTLQSGVTIAATINPDFTNIEGEILDLDFSYVERTVSERRPFFMEGSSFAPSRTIFYSQRVPDIDIGAKAFGTLGDTSFSVLGAGQLDERSDTALYLRQQLTDDWSLQGGFSNRSTTDDVGSAGEIAAGFNHPWLKGSVFMDGWIAGSTDAAPGGEGSAWKVSAGRSGGSGELGGYASYESFSDEFAPINGFVPERDYRGWSGGIDYDQSLDEGAVQFYSWAISGGQYVHQDGSFFRESASMRFYVGFLDNYALEFRFSPGTRAERSETFHDRVLTSKASWNTRSTYESGSAEVHFGKQAGADLFRTVVRQGWRPLEKFGISGSLDYRLRKFPDTTEETTQEILTFNYDITPERNVSGRVVARDQDVNAYLAYRQTLRKGLDLSVILGDPNARTLVERLAVKGVLCWTF